MKDENLDDKVKKLKEKRKWKNIAVKLKDQTFDKELDEEGNHIIKLRNFY
jgi:hypothetical protein